MRDIPLLGKVMQFPARFQNQRYQRSVFRVSLSLPEGEGLRFTYSRNLDTCALAKEGLFLLKTLLRPQDGEIQSRFLE